MSFSVDCFQFLDEIKHNNNRDWFTENKNRYEQFVREPALEFILEMGNHLKKISPHFLAVAKKTGGSLMRVYRDTRFSKDKRPYKTNIGIQFRHEFGKDVHAPGFYLHLEPEQCFVGVGIWHPDSPTLKKIRHHILDEPDQWKRAVNRKAFRDTFDLAGDSLKTAPMGMEKDHPLIVDLRRKDFIGVMNFAESESYASSFPKFVAEKFKAGNGLMRFLCDAVRVPF